jgi:hypothetical protein
MTPRTIGLVIKSNGIFAYFGRRGKHSLPVSRQEMVQSCKEKQETWKVHIGHRADLVRSLASWSERQ